MPLDLGNYRWLPDSGIGEAGCVTVAPGATPDDLASAFGCLPADNASDKRAEVDDVLLVSTRGGTTTVFEDNGFQGSRPEVLRPLSKASPLGKAASLLWNVEGMVILTLAQRGRLLCQVELLEPTEEELEGMPKRLQRQLLAAGSEEPIAVGGALLEAFTGASFGPADLASAVPRPFEPVPDDRVTHTADASPLRHGAPELSAAIVALEPATQRALAEAVARAAVAEAGLADDVAIRATTEAFGSGAAAPLARPTAARLRALEREHRLSQEEQRLADDEGIAGPRIATSFAAQRAWVAATLREATHPDDLSAALGAVSSARGVFLCSVTERDVTLRQDERGRRQVSPETWDPGRSPELDRVLAVLVAAEPTAWPAALESLPAPFTDAEREELVRRDLEREEAGEFQTWQTGPPQEASQVTVELRSDS